MCGITGYWGHSRADLARGIFETFTHSLAHRGPDGSGIEHWPDTRLWLGHRRLAIIDLSDHARQPLSYANGRYWITYNGEIYNYLELREGLKDLGHRFVSNSDTVRSFSPPTHSGVPTVNYDSTGCGRLPSGISAINNYLCRAIDLE